MFRKLGIFYTLCRKLGIFYTLCRKLGIFYTLRLTPEAKTRTLIGFIAKKHCEEKNLSSEKIRHTSMVNSWKIKKIHVHNTLEKSCHWHGRVKLIKIKKTLNDCVEKFQTMRSLQIHMKNHGKNAIAG